MMDGNGQEVREFKVEKRFVGGGAVTVTAFCFPNKHTVISAKFSQASLKAHCNVYITFVDRRGKRYKQYPKVQFHSDGRVVGYGYVEDGVKFRVLKPERERMEVVVISVD